MKKQTPFTPYTSFENALVFEGMVSLRALLSVQKEEFNDRKILSVLYEEGRQKKHMKEYAFLCHRGTEYGFPVILTPKEEIEKLASGKSHGGVLALCSTRTFPVLKAKHLCKQGFFVMMEGVEDPYNFGYALRSLYAAGVDGVILSGGVRTGADGTIARSSAGASELFEIAADDTAKMIDIFHEKGYTVLAADKTDDAVPVYDTKIDRPVLLIVGGEKRGITRSVLEKCDKVVCLDYGRRFGAALSAASAASILAFEIYRQNRTPSEG